jgi:hypothetical protein
MERRGVLLAGLVVFPVILAISTLHFERQMDAIVKTTVADVEIVEDDITADVWSQDLMIYHVTKEVMEKISGYTARLVGYDYDRNVIKVEIYGVLASGSDTGSETAAELFDSLTNNIVDAQVEVTGDFVPSVKNPMDRKWTQHLIEKISY